MAEALSFLIQVNSDTPGLSQLLGGLDKADLSLARVTHGLAGVDHGAHKAGEGAKELESGFDRLIKQGLEPFLHKAEQIAEFEFIREGTEKLLEFPGELAEKLKELSEEIVEAAAHEERLGRAFENALGPDVGRETLEYFDAIADKTEFTHSQIKGMGLELAKSGFEGENLKNAIAAAADLASMTENPLMGGTEAVDALKRIMTTGRIEGRALVPFGIQKGQFEKELSDETGLGIKEMRKQMEAGKIPIETTLNSLYRTITNKTGEDLGGVGTAMTDTLESRLAHLKEKPDLLFERMVDTKGYHELSDFVAELGKALDPNSAIGKILSGALEEAFNGLGDVLSTTNVEGIAEDIAGFIKELPDDIRSAAAFVHDDLVPAVKEAWALFKDIVDFVHTTMEGLGLAKDLAMKYTPLGVLGEPLHGSQDRSKKAIDIMASEGSLPSQSGTGKFLGDHVPGYQFLEDRIFNPQFWKLRFSDATKAGANDVKGYADGVQASTGQAVGAMSQMADATTGALTSAHEQHSPSALFRRIAQLDAEGYVQGISMSQRDVEAAMEEFAQPAEPEQTAAAGGAGGGGGGPLLTIANLELHVDAAAGSDPYDQGRLAARGLEDELELMILRVAEKVAKRMGSR